MLMADMSELRQMNDKEAAALDVVAAISRDGGKVRQKRPVRDGRADVRTMLYMATLHSRLLLFFFIFGYICVEP